MTLRLPRSVTSVPWPRTLYQYGTLDTYHRAAAWLQHCPTVADWGGAQGFFRTCLPATVRYTCVDGTVQIDPFAPAAGPTVPVLADLEVYRAPSDGILLRHVLDNTHAWQPILTNALAAFRRRMVVVTFTADVEFTHRIVHRNGWPTWAFNPDDLRRVMGPLLVRDETVQTSHPERVFYLERR